MNSSVEKTRLKVDTSHVNYDLFVRMLDFRKAAESGRKIEPLDVWDTVHWRSLKLKGEAEILILRLAIDLAAERPCNLVQRFDAIMAEIRVPLIEC
jgi:hypothetical protein